MRIFIRYGQLNPKSNQNRENVFCLGEKSKEKTKNKLFIAGETKEIRFSLVAFCKSQRS